MFSAVPGRLSAHSVESLVQVQRRLRHRGQNKMAAAPDPRRPWWERLLPARQLQYGRKQVYIDK